MDRDGSSWARYNFDSNDNRLSRTDSEGTETGTFDDRDRVLTCGGAAYTWNPDGSLKSRSLGGQTTTLTYDSGGSLLHVGLPGGSSVDYRVDALGRRVTRSVDGQQTRGFLYGGGLGPEPVTNQQHRGFLHLVESLQDAVGGPALPGIRHGDVIVTAGGGAHGLDVVGQGRLPPGRLRSSGSFRNLWKDGDRRNVPHDCPDQLRPTLQAPPVRGRAGFRPLVGGQYSAEAV